MIPITTEIQDQTADAEFTGCRNDLAENHRHQLKFRRLLLPADRKTLMKCQQCSTDAPAETDPQSGRLRCTRCHAFFGTGTTQASAVRNARDILQKWSAADLMDQISSFPQVPPLADPAGSDAVGSSETPPESAQEKQQADDEGAESVIAFKPTEAGVAEEPSETADDSGGEATDILSLSAPSPDADSVGSPKDTPESDPVNSSTEKTKAEVPQLTIVPVDDSVPSDHSPTDASATERVEAETAGFTVADAREQTQKSKRKYVKRPAFARRSIRPAAGASPTPKPRPDSSQQGMDVMKKKFRVDRPVTEDQAAASDQAGSADNNQPTAVDPRAQDASDSRRFRIDTAEDVADLTDGSGRIRSQSRSRRRYIDEAHDAVGLRGPHFAVSPPKRSSLTSLTGQFLAYIGVLGLTIGTAIVIYGHFGGYSEYTPTGWLVTTVAQMLLFLGVINLVSGGIEQNNEDVSRRINVLGEQLMRIEQVTESAMRGPRIPAERYAGAMSADEVSDRATVSADDGRS